MKKVKKVKQYEAFIWHEGSFSCYHSQPQDTDQDENGDSVTSSNQYQVSEKELNAPLVTESQ